MNSSIPLRASPHAHDSSHVNSIMFMVCVALTPATLFGFYIFGWPAVFLWIITIAAAVAFEAVCLAAQQQPLYRLKDNSALLTGWLLAMTLPPWAPWWIGIVGSGFAISVGKQLFGGIGQNLFNPAMLARVALLVSFPMQMTTWANVNPLFSTNAPSLLESLQIVFGFQPLADGVTGATILGQIKASGDVPVSELVATEFSLQQAFFGFTRGSLAETSEFLIFLGGLFLLYFRIISWHIPLSMLLTLTLVSGIFYSYDSAQYAAPWVNLTSGGIMLGAFFIATDYVTSPSTSAGKLLFGFGCGLLIFAIRAWGGFPEAIGFAVLMMNALTPLIDRSIKPRIYGRSHTGKPLPATATPRSQQRQ